MRLLVHSPLFINTHCARSVPTYSCTYVCLSVGQAKMTQLKNQALHFYVHVGLSIIIGLLQLCPYLEISIQKNSLYSFCFFLQFFCTKEKRKKREEKNPEKKFRNNLNFFGICFWKFINRRTFMLLKITWCFYTYYVTILSFFKK